ncbi:MAG TPA: serine/threonine-protein kinase [Candidatus Limnocylindria bacterium]|jgi:eukaryotic-like serine/threonine-protein kinase|nr:serine/threonine-protein kinase [Candidatus Limnocylindria bacterium]
MHRQAVAHATLATWNFAEDEQIVPGRHAVALLGGGERSEAWLAWDERMHTLVVAKLVRPDLVDDDRAMRALEREGEVLARLAHPHIVRCFDTVIDGPRPHLVLEALDGPRLSSLLRRFGPLAPEQIVPLAVEVGSALEFMHDSGHVHLDVKPRNLIMGATPKLIDLGIARTFEEIARLDSPIGTDAYMAPEQTAAETVSTAGPHSDAWGLAVTLYEALEGRLPFDAADTAAGEPLANSRPERYPQRTQHPSPLRRQAHPTIEAVLRAGLVKDHAARASVGEIRNALEELLPAARQTARRRLRRRHR